MVHSSEENFKAVLNKDMVVDSNHVLQVVNSGTAQILDARSRARFLGSLLPIANILILSN